eukprot:COSAG06_NODE_4154_length_4503_cov_3.622283_4_plen_60_part_00
MNKYIYIYIYIYRVPWVAATAGMFVVSTVSKNGVFIKTRLFERFMHKNEHFTKTGSGQT